MRIIFLEVITNLERFSWNEWVYLREPINTTPDSECVVVNPDDADLASDNFTPLEAYNLEMSEFLSVGDLKEIRDNLLSQNPNADQDDICKAMIYYFENDAFVSCD